MKAHNGILLLSLVFFLSAGVFFVLGYGWLAAVDVLFGVLIGGIAWWRRRKAG